jgi:phosphocarrier protein HPr
MGRDRSRRAGGGDLRPAGDQIARERREKMVEKEATIVPEAGLHARPAARFIKEAKSFSSEIFVSKDGQEVSAKSPLRLMTLGAKHGDKVIVRAEGEDEEAAVDALIAILSEEEE